MPNPADEQAQLLREVTDPNGTIAPILPALWSLYADKAAQSPQLVHLYAKRAALDVRLAEEQPDTDFQLGTENQIKRSQRFDHLQQMREDCSADILRIEAIARSSRAPQQAALTTVEPILPPCPGGPDSNDQRYRGSPYIRPLRW